MIDFEKGIVKNTSKSKSAKLKKFRAVIKNNKWFAKSGNSIYEIVNAEDLSEAKILYSLPSNDKHRPWTKKVLDEPIGKKKKDVHTAWSKFIPNEVINGKLKFHTNEG